MTSLYTFLIDGERWKKKQKSRANAVTGSIRSLHCNRALPSCNKYSVTLVVVVVVACFRLRGFVIDSPLPPSLPFSSIALITVARFAPEQTHFRLCNYLNVRKEKEEEEEEQGEETRKCLCFEEETELKSNYSWILEEVVSWYFLSFLLFFSPSLSLSLNSSLSSFSFVLSIAKDRWNLMLPVRMRTNRRRRKKQEWRETEKR